VSTHLVLRCKNSYPENRNVQYGSSQVEVTFTYEELSSTGSKPYRCGATGCRSSFGDPSSCARHRREMHRPRDPFKCPVSGCKSSILRMSAFKAHLKKHGLDPEKHVTCKRGRSFTPVRRSIGPVEIKEERVSNLQVSSRNQEILLPRLPDSLDHFFLYPGDHSTLMTQPGHPSGSGLSYSSSSLPAPSPRIAPACNAGYFLSLPRASSATSSQISMAPTPVLTPEEIGYTRNVGVQLEPAYQDWIPVWQGHGIQFVEQRRGVVGLDM